MLSVEQILEIRKIIREHTEAATYLITGVVPTDVDVDELRKQEIIGAEVPGEIIKDAYLYGYLKTINPTIARLGFDALRERLAVLVAAPIQKQMIKYLSERAALYMRGLGNRIEAGTLAITYDAAKEEMMREVYRETITHGALHGLTRSQLVTEMGHATQDWNRDLQRLACTELHFASQEGVAQSIRDRFGVQSKAFVRPNPDACPVCKKAYLGKDGKPKIFNLVDLEISNIDRKKDELIEHPGKPPLHPNCYHKDTEVYTEFGWRLIKDIQIGEKCLSLSPETLNLEWVPVISIVQDFAEKLYSFQSRSFDLEVTPNHQMFYFKEWSLKQGRIVPAFCDAEALPKEAVFYRSSKWEGEDVDYVQVGKYRIDPILFCKFMGWWLSEGCVTKRGKNCYQICIGQHGPRLVNIFADLSDLPVEQVRLNKNVVAFNDTDFGEYLLQFGKSYQKFVPEIIKRMKPEYIRIFLDRYRGGDGSDRKTNGFKNGNFRDELIYFTSSKRMADDLGELMLKVGRHPSFYLNPTKGKTTIHKNGSYTTNVDMWVLRECYSSHAWGANIQRSIVDYNDIAYCVELAKYHTLWVRKNGKAVWCGNCGCQLFYINPDTQEFDEENRLVFKPKSAA